MHDIWSGRVGEPKQVSLVKPEVENSRGGKVSADGCFIIYDAWMDDIPIKSHWFVDF